MLVSSVYGRTAGPRSFAAEFHYQVCEDDVSTIMEKMQDIDVELNATKRMRISYFDDSRLSVFGKNLIVRLREKNNKNELTLKFRTIESGRKRDYGDCEWDVYRRGKQRSCVVEKEITDAEKNILITHPEKLIEILSAEQKVFLQHYQIDLSAVDFRQLGAVDAVKFEFSNDWVLEDWSFDEKTSIREISWKGEGSNLGAIYQKQLAKLKSVGLNICPTELKKTKFTLDYFLNRNH